MKKTYFGAVCEGGGTYGIVFRDFPGCISAGDTLEEVLAMGAEALQGHVEMMVEHGDPIPEPSEHLLNDVESWLEDPKDAAAETWVGLYPVEVDVPPYPQTVSIAIKTEIVREIASLAERNRQNAHQLIEEAARRELERLRKIA